MQPLRFKERYLKPYVEPITIRDLKEGDVYFAVQFVDDDLCVPAVETLVLTGFEIDEEQKRRVGFQDVESYKQGVTGDRHACHLLRPGTTLP